jgi:hypothetical protein
MKRENERSIRMQHEFILYWAKDLEYKKRCVMVFLYLEIRKIPQSLKLYGSLQILLPNFVVCPSDTIIITIDIIVLVCLKFNVSTDIMPWHHGTVLRTITKMAAVWTCEAGATPVLQTIRRPLLVFHILLIQNGTRQMMLRLRLDSFVRLVPCLTPKNEFLVFVWSLVRFYCPISKLFCFLRYFVHCWTKTLR